MRNIAWKTIIVFATLALLAALWQFREAVFLFIISLGVGAAARPIVDRISAYHIPRGLALALVYLLTITSLVVTFILIGQPILSEIERLSDRFVVFYDNVWASWPHGSQIQQMIVKNLPQPGDLYKSITGAQGTTIMNTFVGFTISSITIASQLFAILVLSIYWSIDRVHFERLWLSLLPVDQRARARIIWREIEIGVGSYIRSELIQSVAASILLGLGFWVLGINIPILLAFFAAIVWLIPWLGVLLAFLPVVWIGLFNSQTTALLAGLYTIVLLTFLDVFIEPRIFNRRQYSSLLIILLMVALSDVFGIVGLIIAPPIAAAFQILFNQIAIGSVVHSTQTASIQGLEGLEDRLAAVKASTVTNPNEPSPQVSNLIERLDTLIHEARDVLTESPRKL